MSRTGFEISKDLGLRENAIKGINQTGYPHLDKSYLQYYSMDDVAFAKLPDISMYGIVLSSVITNYNKIAINYFGRKIKYSELLKHIDEYAITFNDLGIEKGEIVTILSFNTPEVIYSIYALNKIGAVVNFIDYRDGLNVIDDSLKQTKSRIIIMLDNLYSNLKDVIYSNNVLDVYTINYNDSLPLGLNYIKGVKSLIENNRKKLLKCPEDDLFKPLKKSLSKSDKLLSNEDMYIELEKEMGKGNNLAMIVNSKNNYHNLVMLTNENMNSVAYDYKHSGFNYSIGDRFMSTIPVSETYGMSIGMHMPFALGMENVILSSIKLNKIGNVINKYHPNHILGLTIDYEYLLESNIKDNNDLAFIKTTHSFDEVMNTKTRSNINDFLLEHNSLAKLRMGFGKRETAGIATLQSYNGESNIDNELTTKGIPAFYSNVIIEDKNSHEPVKTNIVGEILLGGKSLMKGYYHDSKSTKEVVDETKSGRFYHTGDLGYIDESGCLYPFNQDNRMITLHDGHRVFPQYIEKIILKHDLIEDCCCVGIKDDRYSNGNVPVAFIKVKSGYEDRIQGIIDNLETMSLMLLPANDVARDYIVIDHIPRLSDGKVDYEYLTNVYSYDEFTRRRVL